MNNKKLLSFVLSAAMAATSIFPATVYAAVSGDINGDGSITSADLDILQGYVLGKHDITEEQFKVADINLDQVVDVYDVTGTGKNRKQTVKIHWRFVGYLELPNLCKQNNFREETRKGVALEYSTRAIPA